MSFDIWIDVQLESNQEHPISNKYTIGADNFFLYMSLVRDD